MSKGSKKYPEIDDKDKRVLVNRYRVEKKLGSGNFGTAYLVTDLNADTDKLKVLKEVTVADMETDESIESVHEASLLAKLDNPYILKYHDSFLNGECFCIVTEYCEGGDLDVRFKKLKKENKRLTEQQVLDWTVQLLAAVNYMHSRRVLHRDLKARNIFLKDEIIKIGDFGISRILQGTMDMASTFTGTPYYMSPEVLKHEGYNSKSDIWSIGCLLYEMCTLQHAFEGQGLIGIMYKIVEGKVPELPKEYSHDLNLILKKIFSKNPSERPSSSELLREPLISNHIQSMIKRLERNRLDELENTIDVRSDRKEIARAMNSKTSLNDLKTQYNDRMITQESHLKNESTNDSSDESKIVILRPKTLVSMKYSNLVENQNKEFTPKEKLLLNKLKKADEEAAKVGQIARVNYEERMLRESLRKENTFHSNSCNNLTLMGYQTDANKNLYETFTQSPVKKGPNNFDQNYNRHEYSESSLSELNEDEDEGTLLQTIQQNKKTLNLYDKRPIAPLKKKIEASFTEDGIPLDPQIANEYYENNEFEYDSSPERYKNTTSYAKFSSSSNKFSSRNSLSKTIAPSRNRPTQKFSKKNDINFNDHKKNANKTYALSSNLARTEYEQLIDIQNTLNNSTEKELNETFGDDIKTSAFGTRSRTTKIHNLRQQAIRTLGLEAFEKCYEFLKEKRFAQKNSDEIKIFEELKTYVVNPSDCFLVDQLLFLEES